MKQILRTRWFRILFVLALLVGATGVWVLLHPGSFWLQPWRAQQKEVSSRFIFGPYPLADDFPALQKKGVRTIISLLDPSLPYEKVLLDQETALATRHGMSVRNFPMASILGQRFGADYDANSRAAAQAAIDGQGVAYIHCYLGMHRARNVQKILEAYAHVDTGTYTGGVQSGRNADTQALDQANFAFMRGQYQAALEHLGTMHERSDAARLLEGWSQYRLGRIDDAQTAFTAVAAADPANADANNGLGYCALRRGDPEEAARRFTLVMSHHPDDASAMEGLGYARYRQGQRDEARVLFQRVLEQHPENADVRDLLKKLEPAP